MGVVLGFLDSGAFGVGLAGAIRRWRLDGLNVLIGRLETNLGGREFGSGGSRVEVERV